jgi:hypothetical protein
MSGEREPEKLQITPELEAIERRLTGLTVTPLEADRDRLMFDMGRAAGRAEYEAAARPFVAGTRRWIWPTSSALLAAACVVLSAMLVWQQDATRIADQDAVPPVRVELAVERPAGEAIQEARLASRKDVSTFAVRPTGGYLEARYIALTQGVGDLQAQNGTDDSKSPGGARRSATPRELLEEFIPKQPPSHSES